MAKFKVGDKVRIVDKWGEGCHQNLLGKMDKWLGKVMTIRADESNGCYRMKEDRGENYDGWWWNDACIAGYANDEITITRHGNKVVAKYGKKVGVAKCSPEDTFYFAVGAKLAFSRLMGDAVEDSKPKFKVGEFVKVTGNGDLTHSFPIGSIVQIKGISKLGNMDCHGIMRFASGNYGWGNQCVSPSNLEKISGE